MEDSIPNSDGGKSYDGRHECAKREEVLIDEVAPDRNDQKDDGGQPISRNAKQQGDLETLFDGVGMPLDTADDEDTQQGDSSYEEAGNKTASLLDRFAVR